jgi:hypothetical protein
MGKPAKLHDMQKLAGCVAALSQFVTRSGEKALPFYALMKKSDNKFEWTEEADATFAQLKKVLSTPPVLVAPKEREPLLLLSVFWISGYPGPPTPGPLQWPSFGLGMK